jgi:hypothetical protein
MKPQLSKLYFHMCQRRLQNKYLPSGPNCPPASLCKAGGRGRTSPPALSGVDIRITKIAENNPKRPAPARKDSTCFRTVSRATERCRNRCKRKPPTREPQQNCHPTVKVALSRLAQPPIQTAHGDSCFRLAKQSNHSRGTHFIPAGWAAGRPDFGDRILGPVSGPDLGPRALYLTVGCEAHGPDSWLLFWPEIRASDSGGGATAFLVPREPKFTKLPHSNPILISACGDCTLTADHTIRNVKRHLVPHDQTHTPAPQ